MSEWNTGGQTAWPSNSPPAEVAVEAGQPLQMTQAEKDKLVRDWLTEKTNLGLIQGTELDLRGKVFTALFPNPVKGTQRYVDPAGTGAIKLVFGFNFTLGDKDKIDPSSGQKLEIATQVEEALDKIEALGERGRLLAARLVKWKPELSVTEYEALTGDPVDLQAKAIIDEILTVKPATPQLTYEPPKAAK